MELNQTGDHVSKKGSQKGESLKGVKASVDLGKEKDINKFNTSSFSKGLKAGNNNWGLWRKWEMRRMNNNISLDSLSALKRRRERGSDWSRGPG